MKTFALSIGITLWASTACLAQNKENFYTDKELIQLVNHIKSLEEKTNGQYIYLDFTKLDALNTKIKTQKSGAPANKTAEMCVFSDNDIIKLVHYIKSLEISAKNTIIVDEQYKTALVDAKK